MPNKKRKFSARFPPARIKKIMQKDEDVGKVAIAVPVIISRALEMFIETLILKSADTTKARNSKTLSSSHIKQTILSEKKFDFLKDLVANVPDVQGEEESTDGAANSGVTLSKPPSVRKPPSEPKPTTSGSPVKRPRGRPKKIKPEEEIAPKPTKRKKETSDEESDDTETESCGSEGEEEEDDMDVDDQTNAGKSSNTTTTMTSLPGTISPEQHTVSSAPTQFQESQPPRSMAPSFNSIQPQGLSYIPTPVSSHTGLPENVSEIKEVAKNGNNTGFGFYSPGPHVDKDASQSAQADQLVFPGSTKQDPYSQSEQKVDIDKLSVKEKLSYKLKHGLLPNTSFATSEQILKAESAPSDIKPTTYKQELETISSSTTDFLKKATLPAPPALVPTSTIAQVSSKTDCIPRKEEALSYSPQKPSVSTGYVPPPPLISSESNNIHKPYFKENIEKQRSLQERSSQPQTSPGQMQVSGAREHDPMHLCASNTSPGKGFSFDRHQSLSPSSKHNIRQAEQRDVIYKSPPETNQTHDQRVEHRSSPSMPPLLQHSQNRSVRTLHDSGQRDQSKHATSHEQSLPAHYQTNAPAQYTGQDQRIDPNLLPLNSAASVPTKSGFSPKGSPIAAQDLRQNTHEAQERQNIHEARGRQNTHEARERQNAHEAREQQNAHEARERQKVHEAREQQKAHEVLERQKAHEAQERQKAYEGLERQKAHEAQERQKAYEALERQKAHEARERQKALEVRERPKALEIRERQNVHETREQHHRQPIHPEHSVLDLSSSKSKLLQTPEVKNQPPIPKVVGDIKNVNDAVSMAHPSASQANTVASTVAMQQQAMTQAQVTQQMAVLQQLQAAGMAGYPPQLLQGYSAQGLYHPLMMPGYPSVPALPPHVSAMMSANAPPFWPYAGLPVSTLQSQGFSAAATMAQYSQQQQQMANGGAAAQYLPQPSHPGARPPGERGAKK